MMPHSPTPWRIVRHPTPYGDWIADAEHGVVCGLFSRTDEAILLHAPIYLHAIADAVVALDAGRIGRARELLRAALAPEERQET